MARALLCVCLVNTWLRGLRQLGGVSCASFLGWGGWGALRSNLLSEAHVIWVLFLLRYSCGVEFVLIVVGI
jgi:hypothetical protein